MSQVVITIITAVAGLLGGGTLVALILLPQTKRKENLNNDSLAIAALKDTLNEVRAENNRKDEVISRLSKEKDEALKRYEDKCEESASAKSMLCVHMGCVLRDPALGQGDNYLKAHAGDPTLGADYTPVNQLLQRMGKKRKAMEIQESSEEQR